MVNQDELFSPLIKKIIYAITETLKAFNPLQIIGI